MTYTYLYDQPAGQGVDIYIVDSGVYSDHNEFEERASFGWSAWAFEDDDDDGHGTQVAGIAAGKTYGVAKKASLISVKVLDENGTGSFADSISGLNYVAANARATGRPSIACVASGSEYSAALNNAAEDLIAHGVTVVTAAGNEATDASTTSPASAPNAIVVGASDITNVMASFSNHGSAVDIFAPGVDVTSAWINGPRSTKIDSGTSSSTAHVAGVAAYLLSMDTTMTPADIWTKIDTLSTKNSISNVPAGTVDNFLYDGAY
jgi:cerevisin